MSKSFRDFLKSLSDAGELRTIERATDVRDVSALIEQSPKALMFKSLKDYPDWRLAGGLITTRKRLALAMGTTERQIPTQLERGLKSPIAPVMVKTAPCQEVVHTDPDLTKIPYPMMHVLDGGPYLSATFVVSQDQEFGRNCGSYRLMYRKPNETGIDLVSPSDMRFYYQRRLDKGEPLPIAVAIGVHPYEMLAASYKAPDAPLIPTTSGNSITRYLAVGVRLRASQFLPCSGLSANKYRPSSSRVRSARPRTSPQACRKSGHGTSRC